MKSDNEYLAFHFASLEKGKMVAGPNCETSGLCDIFGSKRLFNLMRPSEEDKQQLCYEGKDYYFWASGSNYGCAYKYTTLRQTIVLLMAAMNGEL